MNMWARMTECCVWGCRGEGRPRGRGMSAARQSLGTGNQWGLQRDGHGSVTQSDTMNENGLFACSGQGLWASTSGNGTGECGQGAHVRLVAARGLSRAEQ